MPELEYHPEAKDEVIAAYRYSCRTQADHGEITSMKYLSNRLRTNMESKLPPNIQNELAAKNGLAWGEEFTNDMLRFSLSRIDAAIEEIKAGRTRLLADAVNELGDHGKAASPCD